MLDSFFNWIFGLALKSGAPWDIIIISLIITLFITIIYKYTTDQNLMKSLKEEQKMVSKEMKKIKDNPEELIKLQKKAMESSMKYFSHSMKPMLFTLLPIIIIFGWMRTLYPAETEILKFPFSVPLFGTGLGWLGTYILSSIVFSIIIRKIMKVH